MLGLGNGIHISNASLTERGWLKCSYSATQTGTGNQIWSWVHIEDLFRAIEHIRFNGITGPVNIVTPEPTSQSNFGRILAQTLNRPFIFKIPSIFLKIGLGEMSIELLSSKKILPSLLTKHGFQFIYPKINNALESEIL